MESRAKKKNLKPPIRLEWQTYWYCMSIKHREHHYNNNGLWLSACCVCMQNNLLSNSKKKTENNQTLNILERTFFLFFFLVSRNYCRKRIEPVFNLSDIKHRDLVHFVIIVQTDLLVKKYFCSRWNLSFFVEVNSILRIKVKNFLRLLSSRKN